ncbi:hypothetical protein N8751_01140 [bacterium]|nr:hypothetical protein [bacterium]
MGFGYLLLAVKSEQDNYLIGNPQFTFFKAVYKKHTNFAIDYQFLPFTGETSESWGKKLYIDIPKNGDLLHRMYLNFDIEFTGGFADQRKVAPLIYNLIDYIDLYIGGQLIDRHYSSWLTIWNELIEKDSVALASMTGIRNQMIDSTTATATQKTYSVPLRFWFNNNIGLALPLIALQYNEVKLEVRIKDKSCFDSYALGKDTDGKSFPGTGSTPDSAAGVVINRIILINELIHLDKEERRLFSTNNHEYLITQVQSSLNNSITNYPALYNTSTSGNFNQLQHKIDMRFSYPIKEIFWTIQDIKGGYKTDIKTVTAVDTTNNIFTLDDVSGLAVGNTLIYEQGSGSALSFTIVNGTALIIDAIGTAGGLSANQIKLEDTSNIAITFNWANNANTLVGQRFDKNNELGCVENKGIYEYNYWSNFNPGSDQLGQANFVINGKDLMDMLPANFYRNVQQFQYHNSAGLQHIDNSSGNIVTNSIVTAGTNDKYFKQGSGIYSYSFALNPEDYQPSGSLNFSKLESAVLKLTIEENSLRPAGKSNGQDTVKTVNMYGINYNVLRIMSGMAGLAFIN